MKKMVKEKEGRDLTDQEAYEASYNFLNLFNMLIYLDKKQHPMKQLNLGKTETGEEVNLDFEKEGFRFTLLVGMTGSGKSIFHYHLYKELAENYTPAEVGFIFMDMTQVDFTQWDSEYMVMPTIVGSDEALRVLESLKDEKRTIFVHIEECDMVVRDRARFEKAVERVLRENQNIYIVYSTSRLDTDYIGKWLEKYVNLKVVFRVSTEEDSILLLGNASAYNFRSSGERMLGFNNKQMKCVPFPEEEVQKLG